tara:strand:- start:368 stop:1135 length:768 start_codon:yes stop_codon:yes gene_type:complete
MLKILLKCPNKFVSAGFIREKIDNTKRISTFGLSSGAIEMDLYQSGHDIMFYSNRYWVYEFWKCLANSPESVISAVKFFHENLSISEVQFHKESWYDNFDDPYDRAAIYYLLNRYSENGQIYGSGITKHNFSVFNLRTLQAHAEAAKKLRLFYLQDEDLIKRFSELPSEQTILLPIGKFKKSYIIQKNPHSLSAPSYDYEKLQSYLKEGKHKMIIVHKYDQKAEKFYDTNKIFINKLGFVTENSELAEDLIVSNF